MNTRKQADRKAENQDHGEEEETKSSLRREVKIQDVEDKGSREVERRTYSGLQGHGKNEDGMEEDIVEDMEDKRGWRLVGRRINNRIRTTFFWHNGKKAPLVVKTRPNWQ